MTTPTTNDSAIDLSTTHHPPCSRTPSSTSSTCSSTLASELDHLTISPTRLDFAKKLGYTEAQVSLALIKLGPEPSQNELLSELILLDGQSSGVSSGGSSGSSLSGVGVGVCLEEGPEELRHVVVDGSNVAMSAGSNTAFSTSGLLSCFTYFTTRGHTVTIFIPSFRKDDPLVSDPSILLDLEKSGNLVWTPSRVGVNKRTICYDDRYILQLAVETEGVVVSNDNYRDLVGEREEFKKVVGERLLMYSFVAGRFTPPEDPLGRSGPSLHQFLRKSRTPSAPPCPYAKKCTYGSKCKYYHPFQPKSVSEVLRMKSAAAKTQSVPLTKNSVFPQKEGVMRTKSASPASSSSVSQGQEVRSHRKLARQLSINPYLEEMRMRDSTPPPMSTHSKELPPFPSDPSLSRVWGPNPTHSDPVDKLRYHLSQIFPANQVDHVLGMYPDCTDGGFICAEIVRVFCGK